MSASRKSLACVIVKCTLERLSSEGDELNLSSINILGLFAASYHSPYLTSIIHLRTFLMNVK